MSFLLVLRDFKRNLCPLDQQDEKSRTSEAVVFCGSGRAVGGADGGAGGGAGAEAGVAKR